MAKLTDAVEDWFGKQQIAEEMGNAELGDKRLNRRNGTIAKMIAEDPGKPFPDAARDEAEIEAFYRFLRHSETSFEKTATPHFEATAQRVNDYEDGPTFAIHDTTQFEFEGGFRDGLGGVSGDKNGVKGFVGHLTQAVCGQMPAGFVDGQLWRRESTDNSDSTNSCLPTKANEGDKWLEGIKTSEQRISESDKLIHLMDRGADAFETLAWLANHGRRFVMRANQHRCIADDIDGVGSPKLKDALEAAPIRGTKTIELGRRDQSGRPLSQRKTHPSRPQREATVQIRSTSIQIRPPAHHPDNLEPVELQAVWIRELDPPEGTQPVDWMLYTSEPVDTFDEADTVVEWYQIRWFIEVSFGVLKGACRIEERQLESAETLTTALGLMLYAAWRLLALRAIAQSDSTEPSTDLLRDTQLKVLAKASETDLEAPEDTTVSEATDAIAQMGGHLSQNGPPGWRVLYRGYRRMCKREFGFIQGRYQGKRHTIERIEQLCDEADNLDDVQKQLSQLQAQLEENDL